MEHGIIPCVEGDAAFLADMLTAIKRQITADLFRSGWLEETVCCLYHQKKDFISVPYEPKDPGYLKKQK